MEHALFAAEAAFFFGAVSPAKRPNAATPKPLLKSSSTFAGSEFAVNGASSAPSASFRNGSTLG